MYEAVKISLALDIISAHFGNEIGRFARSITENVLPVSLRDILSSCSFSKEFSISALGVLFQHNLLIIHEKQAGAKIEISAIKAIFRLLFPRFKLIFEKHFGPLGGEVARIFFTQGRMTEIALRAQITSNFRTQSEEWRKSIYDTFRKIIATENPFIESSVFSSLFDPQNLDADTTNETGTDSEANKRSRGSPLNDGLSGNEELVYTIDLVQLIRSIRSVELLSSLRRKFTDDVAITVQETLLENDNTRASLTDNVYRFRPFKNTTNSLPLESFSHVFQKKQKRNATHILEGLCSRITGGYLNKSVEGDSSIAMYILETGKIVEEHRIELVLRSISKKFGVEGVRIFRFLMKQQRAEEMVISDACKISPESVRTCLFELQKMGFAQAQCISGAPKDAFLWCPNIECAIDELLFIFLKTIRILLARLHSVAQGPEISDVDSYNKEVSDRRLAHAINETLILFLWIDVF